MKVNIILFTLAFSFTSLMAQEGEVMKTEQSCGLSAATIVIPAIFEFESNAEATQVVNDIMKTVGLRSNFRIQAADVPNAAAVVMGSNRYILYNPDFIQSVNKRSQTDWSSISIIAHELGHHLNGHTLTNKGSRPRMELEADEFSGFVLRKMGASLEESQAAMNLLASPFGSMSHPPKANRLRAIQRGWEEADAMLEDMGAAVATNDGGVDQTPVVTKVPTEQPTPDPVNKQTEADHTPPAPVPDIEQHPVNARYRVTLYANQGNRYYINTRSEFVMMRGKTQRAIGRLSRIEDSNYTSVIKMETNSPDLFIARGGFLVTEGGNKVGEVKRIN